MEHLNPTTSAPTPRTGFFMGTIDERKTFHAPWTLQADQRHKKPPFFIPLRFRYKSVEYPVSPLVRRTYSMSGGNSPWAKILYGNDL